MGAWWGGGGGGVGWWFGGGSWVGGGSVGLGGRGGGGGLPSFPNPPPHYLLHSWPPQGPEFILPFDALDIAQEQALLIFPLSSISKHYTLTKSHAHDPLFSHVFTHGIYFFFPL